jgi:hypothetical protein
MTQNQLENCPAQPCVSQRACRRCDRVHTRDEVCPVDAELTRLRQHLMNGALLFLAGEIRTGAGLRNMKKPTSTPKLRSSHQSQSQIALTTNSCAQERKRLSEGLRNYPILTSSMAL